MRSKVARRAVLLALVVAGVLAGWSATASGVTLQCGATITQDTTLDNDIVCADPAAIGLIIAADNITVKLRGHSITGAGATGEGSIAITDDGLPHTGVTIRDATISGFDEGIYLQASSSNVMGITFAAADSGLILTGDDNYVFRNTMASAGTVGFDIAGDNAYLWGNKVTGKPDDGIGVVGENPLLVYNKVTGCGTFNGITVSGYTKAKLARNTVTGCGDTGVDMTGQNGHVQSNDLSGNFYGLFVSDPGAVVWRNNANGNSINGITVGEAGATVAENTANNNSEIGIDAVQGTIDAGGNHASGNLIGDCFAVVCQP